MGALVSKCKCNDLAATTDSDPAETLEQGEASKGIKHKLPNSQNLGSEKTEIERYSISLAETLNNFRHQELFVDFKITVSEEDFPVHKNVLAASCKFFRDLFKVSGAAARYELPNVEPAAVGDILNFLYTGKCRLRGQQKAESALCIAHFLGIKDLQEPLERYVSLVKEISALDNTAIQEEFFMCREESILKAIMEFWVEGLFCDLTLTTSCGRIIPVHKNVLAAISCYFQGLFRSDMKEARENNVDLSMVDEAVVNELLHFIYSGEIFISFHNIRTLLQATDYLRTTIVAFLKGSTTVSNFWCIFDLVKSFNCLNEIDIDILQLTRNSFWEITQAEEFLEITEEDLKYFLSNDDIVSSETQVLESLIRWYKSFKNLLHLVHMTSIPDLYLKFLAEREGIDELHSYTGHQLRAKVSLDDLKRYAHFYNLVMFGLTHDPHYPGNQLCYWLPFAGLWSYISSSYTCLESTTPLVFTGDAFYLRFYGLNPQLTFFNNPLSARHFKHSSSLCSPTLVERVIETTAPQDCTAVPLGSSIYFTGGQVHDEACSTVQRYNINKQSWDSVASMQERRYYHSAVNFRDRCIYVFGGIEGVGCINRIYKSTVERYDPQQDTWSYVASMQQPRRDGLTCVFGDKIFLMGGESAECACAPKCEVYDQIGDVWQMVCFQIKEVYTLKSCQVTGIFNNDIFCNDNSSANSNATETDPLELKVCMPQDEGLYDHAYLYKPSATCCDGSLIIFGFGSFSMKNLRLPFYFVNPETGNFRILYSLPSWPSKTSLCLSVEGT